MSHITQDGSVCDVDPSSPCCLPQTAYFLPARWTLPSVFNYLIYLVLCSMGGAIFGLDRIFSLLSGTPDDPPCTKDQLMNFEQAINIEDLHRIAKRKLPRIIFDCIEGGVEDERGLARNEAAFHKHRLLPRYLVDVSKRDQSATLFGRTYASPFGISPTGGVGLYRREGEVMLAEAA